jgi:hypothetical protein
VEGETVRVEHKLIKEPGLPESEPRLLGVGDVDVALEIGLLSVLGGDQLVDILSQAHVRSNWSRQGDTS